MCSLRAIGQVLSEGNYRSGRKGVWGRGGKTPPILGLNINARADLLLCNSSYALYQSFCSGGKPYLHAPSLRIHSNPPTRNPKYTAVCLDCVVELPGCPQQRHVNGSDRCQRLFASFVLRACPQADLPTRLDSESYRTRLAPASAAYAHIMRQNGDVLCFL
jgi:hypothetical protein